MDAIATGRKLMRGSPYLVKELRAIVSDHTGHFIAVPRTVHIWRGAPCNAKCVMCPWGFLTGEALRPFVRSAFSDDDMPRALFQIADLCGRGTIVSYMGGEPMLSKRLVDWVEQAAELRLDFRFTTNGYLMTETLARRLVAAGAFNRRPPGCDESLRARGTRLLDQNLTTARVPTYPHDLKGLKRSWFAGLFSYGASRTRTGDLLGAISLGRFVIICHRLRFPLLMRFLRGSSRGRLLPFVIAT
jgi:hypothetical protein